MRIQEGHFLKIALNLVLTLPDDGECLTLLISCGIIDLGAFCVELWSFLRQQKNLGPNVIYFVLRVDSCVSLPRGQKSMKTAPANPRRSLFENCSKSRFDTAR